MLRLFLSLQLKRSTLRFTMPSKRARSTSVDTENKVNKRSRSNSFTPRKVASAQNSAAVDAHPPFLQLLEAVKKGNHEVKRGKAVVYWMRMADLRGIFFFRYLTVLETDLSVLLVSDNHALSLASAQAKKEEVPLIVLFVISPQDYKAHDRGARYVRK